MAEKDFHVIFLSKNLTVISECN